MAKGKIISQEPLSDSDLQAGGAVQVIVSSGKEKIAVPAVVGEPIEAAKKRIADKGLIVGKVLETGEGDPGTVTEVQPKVGTLVEAGGEIIVIMSPAGKPVPNVVGKYLFKAKKEVEEAGFKVGKIRRRYNDYQDENVILSQEPAAETIVPLGTAIDLIAND